MLQGDASVALDEGCFDKPLCRKGIPHSYPYNTPLGGVQFTPNQECISRDSYPQ